MNKIKKIMLFLLLILFVSPPFVYATKIYSKAPINIEDITIQELQEYLEKEYLTSELLVTLYLERIEKYDSKYNAITIINKDALAIAKKLDIERKENGARSILHGIPIVIKDNFDIVGLPTTAGARALLNSYPLENSFIVQNLIEAGAIIIAKTNMDNFAFTATKSTSSFKTTANAYDINYSSYGSSGGTAVAIATNMAVVGLGTDTNSSLRGPAAVNNIVGLRPTMGLTSRSGILPYTRERDVAGPMTRTVSDLAILLDFMVGYDINDAITKNGIDKIPPTYTDYLNIDGLEGKKVGVIEEFIKADNNSNIPTLKYSSPDMEQLMTKAIKDMERLGAKIIYINNFYTNELNNLFYSSLNGRTFCRDLNDYFQDISPENSIKTFQALMNDGRYVYPLAGYAYHCNDPWPDNEYELYTNNVKKYEDYITKIIDKYDIDVFAYPTLKTKPITISNNQTQPYAPTSHTIAPTIGWPSINVPMGFDSEGLPYGLQFTAEAFSEGKLIEISYAYEQGTNHRQSPKIAPSLYKFNDDTALLIEKINYIEDNINLNNYINESANNLIYNLDIAKTHLYNYNESNEDSTTILNDLNSSLENLELKKIDQIIVSLKNDYVLYLLSISFIIILLRKRRKRMKKRKKRRKKTLRR